MDLEIRKVSFQLFWDINLINAKGIGKKYSQWEKNPREKLSMKSTSWTIFSEQDHRQMFFELVIILQFFKYTIKVMNN